MMLLLGFVCQISSEFRPATYCVISSWRHVTTCRLNYKYVLVYAWESLWVCGNCLTTSMLTGSWLIGMMYICYNVWFYMDRSEKFGKYWTVENFRIHSKFFFSQIKLKQVSFLIDTIPILIFINKVQARFNLQKVYWRNTEPAKWDPAFVEGASSSRN